MTIACQPESTYGPSRIEGVERPGFFTLLEARWERHLAHTALSSLVDGTWRRLSYCEVQRMSRRLAGEIRGQGHARGAPMAILAESGPSWGIAFLALLRAGGTAVPLDPGLEVGELAAILADARPVVLLVSPREIGRARVLERRVASIAAVVVLDPGHALEAKPGEEETERSARFDRSLAEIASITYTSGTTGAPKGVMTTFGNLVHQATSLGRVHSVSARDRWLSVLPLSHMFELVGGLFAALWSGAEVCYGNSLLPADVMGTLRDRRITRMLCVPLLLELIQRQIVITIADRSRGARMALGFVLHTRGQMPSLLKRFLLREIRGCLGGSLRSLICGGAPLEPRTERFFECIGLPVYQGYGLTETSPVIAVNTPRHRRYGSVGRPLPGVELRIEKRHADDFEGEILTRGPHVMAGYRGRPALTAEVLDEDGWFRTGDLGRLDADGYLFVTGRAKSLIVLGTGKKVQPEEVERCLGKSPLVAEVCVVGITSADETLPDHERVCAVVVPAQRCPEAEVVDEVRRRAQSLATYKRPSAIVVRAAALPRTSTAKVRRDEVARQLERGERRTS